MVSEPLKAHKRHAWRPTTWPQILRLANERKALLLFGDAASFPPWGTLTSTWARRGQQPQGKPCGKRHGAQVFGLIDSFPGHFFSQGQDGRLHSAAYMAFLTRGLAPPTHPSLLMQDGAMYHTSAATTAVCAQQTARLQGVPRPAYAPAYNPIEKLWKKIKQQDTHLHALPTFEALTEQVEQALLKFPNAPEAILAFCSLPTALAQAA